MATYQILRWQEIPAVVEARDENGIKKQQLSKKFQALIDEAAMRRNLDGTDAYLEQWNKSDPVDGPGTAAEVLTRVVQEIESRFMVIRDQALKKTSP
ncbi:MAG: hypothetical protein FJX37_00510 [Alphaproteobacteria bacterium]|nr:hypothetical protein [Alphaproteobacteria bacterium]MBM3951592.1 hypothetical protein [Rhodospirillales bacterium]